MRRGGLRRNHLGRRRAALDVRQEAQILIRLVVVLEVRGPCRVQNSLSLLLLLPTHIKEESCPLLTKLLREASELSLLHTKPRACLPRLNTELAVLRTKTADTLCDLSGLLGALKPQAAGRFGTRETHLGLSLPQLTGLLSHLTGELFSAEP